MIDGDGTTTVTDDAPFVFRDAEAFLAELGVERNPIVVRIDDEGSSDPTDGVERDGDTADADAVPGTDEAPVSATEAQRIASEAPPDDVAAALSYVRASTGAQPASEGRLRERLADRGHDEAVIAATMEAARAQRLVDDDALSAALVAEWRAQGHAPRRVRQSLRRRGFDEDVVERAVGELDVADHTAMAFDLARKRAETLAHLPPETAFRRVVGYVGRRGYGEGLARKVARDAVFDQRADERIAGR